MISGLTYFQDFLSNEEHDQLLEYLTSATDWAPVGTSSNSRLVLQYGSSYNYASKTIIAKELDTTMLDLIQKIKDRTSLTCNFNQCIVNRYLPSQGISKHTDSRMFGNEIACITIGSATTITFRNNEVKELRVEPRSLYIMKDEVRYNWTHEINPRHNEGIRYSITFRTR